MTRDAIISFDEEGKNAFMSNFYPSEIALWTEFGWQQFPTVEHAYQWHKPQGMKEKAQIQEAATPGIAKKLGRKCKMVQDWELMRVNVMCSCLLAKFSNPYLRKLLKNTEKKDLIEGNTWNDEFWGATEFMTGFYRGANVLGQLLMQIRNVC